ncbi:hypothetical protein GCM10009663_59430 [Kitasatospora arboriphila]|uniref:Uncharacterized protein n=1 Tax=Kitasatospora arboriphila TaxID=258052 RepID=A0ABP4EKT6_9ACTN
MTQRCRPRRVEAIPGAPGAQTAIIPGRRGGRTDRAKSGRLATAVLNQHKLSEKRNQELPDEHPLPKILNSMPGTGAGAGPAPAS